MYVGKYSSASVIIQNSIKENSNPRHQIAMVPTEYVTAHRISEANITILLSAIQQMLH